MESTGLVRVTAIVRASARGFLRLGWLASALLASETEPVSAAPGDLDATFARQLVELRLEAVIGLLGQEASGSVGHCCHSSDGPTPTRCSRGRLHN